MFPINVGVEDAEQLLCDSFTEYRRNLFTDVNIIFQNNGHLVWNNNFLQHLLYGDESLSYAVNRSILTRSVASFRSVAGSQDIYGKYDLNICKSKFHPLE